ncbi:MAG: hypothetical protein U9N76_07645 [Candidatus Marinimicrobia bacterium]|nr:hypothetical protein [Candidatus Neomarinimicrobiota bacterium]
MKSITLATSENKLAIWQTNHIKELLKSHYPQLDIYTKIIRSQYMTNNDFDLNDEIPEIYYNLEMEEQLFNNDIQIAIHNTKHLSNKITSGLMIAGYSKRDYSENVFVSFHGEKIDDDLDKFTVGITNFKDLVLMKKYYPHIKIVILTGDLKSLIFKVKNLKLNGIILDKINVNRLNASKIPTEDLKISKFMPSAGQGATAMITLNHRFDIIELLQPILDKEAYDTVTAERAFINKLNINNNYPVGVFAKYQDNKKLSITGFVASADGKLFIKENLTKPLRSNSDAIGKKLANVFLKNDKFNKIIDSYN